MSRLNKIQGTNMIALQEPTITITAEQIIEFQTLLTTLNTNVQNYLLEGSFQDAQTLSNFLYDDLLDFLDDFPYQGVTAYSEFTIVGTTNLLDIPTTLPGAVTQLLQQLYDALGRFIDQLILDIIPYNQLMESLLSAMTFSAFQPVTAAIPITNTEQQALLNFTAALVLQVSNFLTSPTPANNQNLQNLFIQFYIFFRDYSVPDYAVYGRFLSQTILQALNETPLSLGKVTQLLLSFYTELASFIERLEIELEPYDQLLEEIATVVAITASVQTGNTPTPIQNAGYFYSTNTTAIVNNSIIPISTVGTVLGNAITFNSTTTPNTITLTAGLYEISYSFVGDPLAGNETVIIELRIDGVFVPGSRVYSQSVTGGGQPLVTHTMLINISNPISNLQVYNVSGETIQYLDPFNGATTSSVSLIKLT